MSSLLPVNEIKELHKLDEYFGSRIDKLNHLNLQVHPLFVDKKYLSLLSNILEIDISGIDEKEARELLSLFVDLKKYTGTVYALKRVLKIFSKDIHIKEWFHYDGQPYHFKVEISSQSKEITPELYKHLTKQINAYKNVRSVLEEIQLSYLQKHTLNINIGCGGEATCTTKQLEGYTHTLLVKQNINIGCMAELTAYAKMR